MAAEQPWQVDLNLNELRRECLACGVVVVDEQRRISACNEAAQRVLGIEAVAQPQPEGGLPACLAEIVGGSLASGAACQEERLELPGSGEAGPVVCSINVQPFAMGESRGAVVLLQPELPHAKVECMVRRLERLASIGTLSAGMAHEIKNALVAVKTCFELIPRQSGPLELADIAGKEVRRIDAIISQMLRFSGPAKPIFVPLRLHELVEHSLRAIQYQLAARRIIVRQRFATQPLIVLGDHYQLEQALMNLLLNAMESMGSGGQLTVSTEAPGLSGAASHACLAIQDTGPGIPAENVARLFEPFFTTKSQGTGLGLAITRRIIHEHNGTISVQTEPGQGTTFKILLPLQDGKNPGPAPLEP
jgi:signal transduction histidine kinase